MADLNELQSSMAVKVAGADPTTGSETNFANVDANGNLYVETVLRIGGQFRNQGVTTTVSEALGGVTILANRSLLIITPVDGTVYWGYANTVTTANGMPLFKNQTLAIQASELVHIYLIAAAGTVNCRISEGA